MDKVEFIKHIKNLGLEVENQGNLISIYNFKNLEGYYHTSVYTVAHVNIRKYGIIDTRHTEFEKLPRETKAKLLQIIISYTMNESRL